MDRILQQLLNMVLRKLMNRGMKAGINHLSRGGKPPQQMTPEEREQAAKARDLADKARKMTRLSRRL